MSRAEWRETISRWWAHRKLSRGQCGWCGRVLPDAGSISPYWRACSEDCATQMWATFSA